MSRTNAYCRIANRAVAALLVVVVALISRPVLAGSEVNTGYFGSVAIQGYDPVAYFTRGEAMKGREEYELDWLGATWRFTTSDHKQAFAASPLRYAPQYGGHCSVGVAFGEVTTEVDPEAWTIIDGKLYLNYSKEVNKGMTREIVNKADARWQADVRRRAAAD